MSDFENKYNSHHKMWSYVKSLVRIVACFLAVPGIIGFWQFALMFLVAEIIGIVEEWV